MLVDDTVAVGPFQELAGFLFFLLYVDLAALAETLLVILVKEKDVPLDESTDCGIT